MKLWNILLNMKKRVVNLFFVAIILVVLFVVYYYFCEMFPNLSLKCLFFELTGLQCPGCGVTRMLFSFFELEFLRGVQYNYFLAFSSPVLMGILGYFGYTYICDKKTNKFFDIVCFVYILLLIVWGILRNIVGV